MQSTLVALLAVFAAGVCAAPVNAGTCDIKTCIVALQPSFPTACDPAAQQQGANTQLNTACLVAAAKGTASFPTACSPCATQFGVTDPGQKSQTATNGATGNTAATKGRQGTAAAPAPNNNGQAVGPRATCDIKTCVVALQPPFPTACDPAAQQQGANTQLNTACLVAAAKGTAPFPTACSPCATQFGVTDPGQKSQTATNGANGATGKAAAANGRQGTAAAPTVDNNGQAVGPRATCNIKACVVALKPSSPQCAPAVTKLGADNSSNAACLAAAAKGTAAFPSACDGCAAQFGVTDPGANAKAKAVATNQH